MAIRVTYQKQLRLDDAFLFFAVACLCAATGILYHICYFLYLHSAAVLAPEVLPEVLAKYNELIGLQKKVYPFLALIWTTTFAVKACFLAFMRPLVWHISRALNWYYWSIVVFCIISWAYTVADPFIICPYFGVDASQYCEQARLRPAQMLTCKQFSALHLLWTAKRLWDSLHLLQS